MRTFEQLPRKERIRLLNLYLHLAVREFENGITPDYRKGLTVYEIAATYNEDVIASDFDLIKDMNAEQIVQEFLTTDNT